METHLFAEIAVNRFNNSLREQVFDFIKENKNLADLYRKAEERYSRRVINNVLEDFLVKGLQEHKPIYFTDDPEYSLAEETLEKVANEFIGQLPDRIFLSIENDPELMGLLIDMPASVPEIQENIREILMDRYFVIPTGMDVSNPESNLLNNYRRMMLKSEEEV
ncbi:MAG: hypothetical protein RR346_11215 [Bacteroidales bacterium]